MEENPLESLRTFALKALAAEKYPGAHHRCRKPVCPACGTAPLAVMVETHSGSSAGHFRGVIHGRCEQCGSETDVFRFTGPHRAPVKRERLTCRCGQGGFWLIICERIEGENGLPGFFDEGVVGAHCAACGHDQVIACFD